MAATHCGVAHAQEKLVGVRAWTSGSQTYIRIRPDVGTPPVAKVPVHTQLHIWGKKDGWYRVETPDKKFGWVYHKYINAPDARKVRELSAARASKASARTSHQKLYGSPELLKSYYSKYKDPAAAKALQKRGIAVAAAPKAPKAKAAPQTSARLVSVRPPVAPVAVNPLQQAARLAVLGGEASPRKTVAGKDMGLTSRSMGRQQAALRIRKDGIVPVSTPSGGTMASRVQPATIVAPDPEFTAGVSVSEQVDPSTLSQTVLPVKIVTPAVGKLPPMKKPETWAEKKRAALRARLAAKPSSAPVKPSAKQFTPVLPISPEALMRARAAYLLERQKRYGTAPTRDAGVAESANTVRDTATVQPTAHATPGVNRNSLTLGGPRVITLVNQQQSPSLKANSKSSATPAAKAKAPLQVASRSKTTATAPVYRGGSPRDLAMARAAASKGQAGQTMASRALSYRGMPYRRGAASPSRGFDCSGLVYYLLRQRGYNPPRTAAGYKNYGQGVAKSDLKAGDLLLFANTYKRGISHIGIYTGNGKFVHAATSGTGVRVDSLGSGYYAAKYHSARRAP